MSDVLAGSMGGSSGVLLSIFLTSIGRAYAQTGAWPKALESGIASLQTYGGAAVGVQGNHGVTLRKMHLLREHRVAAIDEHFDALRVNEDPQMY